MDVPQVIAGRFRIECEIGRGGMGTVYRATHLGLDRPVAVKIIKPEFAGDHDVADRFLREARTMAKLRHPHAAMIFDAGSLPDGRHFIIMEFVEGTTLSEALDREGRFSAEQAVKMGVQICEVLDEAHRLGIIHRDLKPSNIMLNDRGVCVLDFGVAKVLVTSAESTKTHATTGSGQLVGTPRYMSPEQCLGQRVGIRSDLYSLGVVLYEMLAGRPPFIDPLPSAVLVKQATAQPPPLPQLRQDIPKQLAVVIHALLAKRPENRPRTAGAVKILLEQSLLRPRRDVPEAEPLSATIAAVAQRSSIVFRLAGPLATVILCGALLFVWGNHGENSSATAPESPEQALESSTNTSPNRTVARKLEGDLFAKAARSEGMAADASFPSIAPDRVRRLASTASRNSVGDVQILRTPSGPAVVGIHDESQTGTSRFFVMQKRGAGFRVSARGVLDTSSFRSSEWTAEAIDANGDGYNEVLFTGFDARGSARAYRLIVYVPGTKQLYSLQVERGRKTRKSIQFKWSANTVGPHVADYRKALLQHAKSLVRTGQT